MNRRMTIKSLALALSLPVAIAAFGATASAQTITLKVADSYPPSHIFPTHGTKPWMDRITELTNGKVQFQYYPAEQLGKIGDLPQLVRDGVADIGLVAVGLFPGDYPLASVGAMPGTAETALEATQAYWKLVSQDGPLRKEFTSKGLHPLAYFGLPQYEIVTGSKEIKSLADLKGLKIRAGGGLQQQLVEGLGASPIQLPTPELYSSIERSTIDGVMIPYTSALSYKFPEVAKYATEGAALGSTIVGYAISEANWAKLPADIQTAIETASDEFMTRISKYQDDTNAEAKGKLEAAGMTVSKLSPETAAEFKAAVAPVAKKWVDSLEARGLPAGQVYEAWIAATGGK